VVGKVSVESKKSYVIASGDLGNLLNISSLPFSLIAELSASIYRHSCCFPHEM